MSREETYEITCDECKVKVTSPELTPHKWLRLTTMYLIYRKTDNKKTILSKNCLDIDDDTDPDFCSKKCFIKFIEKEVDKIMK